MSIGQVDLRMHISFRPARSEDIPRMCDLLADLFSIEADFEPDRAKQARGLALLLTDPTGSSSVAVAVHDKVVIGMATVQKLVSTAEGGRAGVIEDIIVDRHFRGQGVGTLLLNHVIAWSREQGLTRLQLLADRDNSRALAFYAANGWNRTNLICLTMKSLASVRQAAEKADADVLEEE